MYILIDECLPKKLKQELSGHTVFTVQEKGWSGIENGDLLRIAEKECDVWLTADKNKKLEWRTFYYYFHSRHNVNFTPRLTNARDYPAY